MNAVQTTLAESLPTQILSTLPFPPLYTPRQELTVPRESHDGSPLVGKSEFVEIDVDLRWPDKHSRHQVRRSTKQDVLKNITPVKKLLAYHPETEVTVSPLERAKSNTRVHIDTSYEDLVQHITHDVTEAIKAQNDKADKKQHEKLKRELRKEFEEMVDYEKVFTRMMWMRIIQDQVYYKMSDSLQPGAVPKEWPPFSDLVSDYEETYSADILTDTDLHHLRSATNRTRANDLVHPGFKDFEAVRMSWRGLDARLAADGLEEERLRYRRYYQFATGDLVG